MTDKTIAIWAITDKACQLGRKCLQKLNNSFLFIPEKHHVQTDLQSIQPYSNLSTCIKKNFHQYNCHLFIMATGIVIRNIAPFIHDKTTDPAVVVLDESCHYVISLLSGHIGGANDFACEISQHIGAKPVITTATDLRGILSFDSLAAKIDAVVENKDQIKLTSTHLLQKRKIAFIGPKHLYDQYYQQMDHISFFHAPENKHIKDFESICIVSEKINPQTDNKDNVLLIRPRNLIIGIGLNKGTSQSEIENSVKKVFAEHHLSVLSVKGIATIKEKANEEGLTAFARNYQFQIHSVDKAEINRISGDFFSPASPYAMKHLGVFGVAEPASFIAAGQHAELIVHKQKIGNVTIAISKTEQASNVIKKGKLFLVGIGPGDTDYMTEHARRIIEISDMIAGYYKYLELIRPLITNQTKIQTGMTKEKERVRAAIKAANDGNIVSLVCSGDTGIYGMAGLVFETIEDLKMDIEIEISPGITASTSAAALAGAPIMNDFITISLSDLLTPTEKVLDRIQTAAKSDMVTVVYNPKSKKRIALIQSLQKQFLECHDNSTPVAIVTHAFRSQQQIVITNLLDFLDFEINMNSILVIGNSDTTIINNRMVTKRGYSIS